MVLWDVELGKCRQMIFGQTSDVHAAAFGDGGKVLVSAGDDALVRVFDLRTGHPLAASRGHCRAIPTLDVSPDGLLAATGGRDGEIRLWTVPAAVNVRTLTGHTADVLSVVFGPDGSAAAPAADGPSGVGELRLASASYDGSVRLWDVNSGEELRRFKGHDGWVYTVAFHPDGRHLASGGRDGKVRLWDVDTGAELARFGQQEDVAHATFSPDGARLASASSDGSVVVWDVARGRIERTLRAN
jgi:WD40 repeat protein